MFCSECGQQNVDDAKFCMKCGKQLEMVETSTSTVQKPEPSFPTSQEPVLTNTFENSSKHSSIELKDSGIVTTISVIGFVFGLIGMLGSFIPCIGSLAFFIGIPAAIISAIGLGIAYSQKAKKTFAIVAVTISLIGVVISGWQYFSIVGAGNEAKRQIEHLGKESLQQPAIRTPEAVPTAPTPKTNQASPVNQTTKRNELTPTNTVILDSTHTAKVVQLKFFESPKDITPKGDRHYNTVFKKLETKYICYEMNLEMPKTSQRRDFKIDAIWYNPQGVAENRNTLETYVLQGWNTSHHAIGWSPDRSLWTRGTYVVELFQGSTKIASGTFEIQ